MIDRIPDLSSPEKHKGKLYCGKVAYDRFMTITSGSESMTDPEGFFGTVQIVLVQNLDDESIVTCDPLLKALFAEVDKIVEEIK